MTPSQLKKCVGKRITEIVQTRVQTNSGRANNIDKIVLEDGTVLRFSVREGENEYSIEANAYPAKPCCAFHGAGGDSTVACGAAAPRGDDRRWRNRKPDRRASPREALPPLLNSECECGCHTKLDFKHPNEKPCCGLGAPARCEDCRNEFETPTPHGIGDCPRCGSDQTFLRNDGSYERIREDGRRPGYASLFRRRDPGDDEAL